MQTINISLPDTLATKIDRIVGREGYASRSEFIRALIRFYLLSQRKEEVTLMPFKKVPIKKVESEMKATGRYSKKFIESIIKGLSQSSLYVENKTSSK